MEQEEIDALVEQRLARQRKKHDELMDNRGKEIELLEAKVKSLTEQVVESAALKDELTALRSRVQRSDRLEIMRQNNIPEDALDDISAIYQSRMSTVSEEEKQDWATFLGEEGMGRQNVLLSQYFKSNDSDLGVASASQADAVSGSSVRPSSSGLPSGNAGVTPIGSAKEKMTSVELARYFSSPEYRSLPAEQQKAKFNELSVSHRSK